MIILLVRLDGMVCIVSFEVITQRERLCYKPQCLAEMDVCMEEDSVTEELSAFIAPLSLSTQNVDSGRHLSHGSSWLQILQKFPYFQKSWGSKCVPGSLFFPPVHKSLGGRL